MNTPHSEFESEGSIVKDRTSLAHRAAWGKLYTHAELTVILDLLDNSGCEFLVLPPDDLFELIADEIIPDGECCACYASTGHTKHCGEIPGRDCYEVLKCTELCSCDEC